MISNVPVIQSNPFQPTLPVWGETRPYGANCVLPSWFQPTLPVWGETFVGYPERIVLHISTHSPRVGRDPVPTILSFLQIYFNPLSPCGERPVRRWTGQNKGHYFNPLSPCGERPQILCISFHPIVFQPTLPVWGETIREKQIEIDGNISTPSPRVGRDLRISRRVVYRNHNFNPLSPCGERRKCPAGYGSTGAISTHSPRVGRDGRR